MVISDIEYFSGKPDIMIPARASKSYVFSVQPLLGGRYFGQITFQEETMDGKGEAKNNYIWYTVEIKTDRPLAKK